MDRTIEIEIDRTSWPRAPKLPRFPRAFMGLKSVTLNVPAVLLRIGFLTTPTSVTGVSLSEFWAWVRYLPALTADDDLRLTAAFASLDAHQRTILSDDFGMGFPMHWLASTLDFRRICDGRYFVQRFAGRANATVTRTAKRGPNKTPDFVARDARGVWHVVECKGTQSGKNFQSKQIGNRSGGGIAQKRAIVFPAGHTGQRLVCALGIAIEGQSGNSNLKVVDPPPEKPFRITRPGMRFAEDAIDRSTLAKSLRLAGFEATADVTAAPDGRFPWSRPYKSSRFEEARMRLVEAKTEAARVELDRERARSSWTADGNKYRGRELTFVFPRPIIVDGEERFEARIRQGINEDVLGELRNNPRTAELVQEAGVGWRDAFGQEALDYDRGFARLRLGQLFDSELILK